MGEYLNSLSPETQKYVIVNQPGVPVPYPDGVPMPAQTIMFIEKTNQTLAGSDPARAKYVLPEDLEKIIIERGAPSQTLRDGTGQAVILPMREDPDLFIKLWEKFPQGKLEKKEGFWIFLIK